MSTKTIKLPKVDEKHSKRWNKLKKKWTKKLGLASTEFDTKLLELLEKEKETHPDWDINKQFYNAMRLVFTGYKKQLASPAISFDFFLIGIGDLIDTVARRRREAFKAWGENRGTSLFSESNPTGHVMEIYRDDFEAESKLKDYEKLKILGQIHQTPKEGGGETEFVVIPIDNRDKFKSGKDNPFFGQPLQLKSYMRFLYGMGMHEGFNAPRFMTITLNDKLAEEVPPMWTPLQARFNWKPTKEQEADSSLITEYRVSGSTSTNFKEVNHDVPDSFEDLIKDHAPGYFVEIEQLELWHDENAEDRGRICVTEGDVTQLMLEPTQSGSRRLIIDDISLEVGNDDEGISRGITCWIPRHVDIDFGEESRVLVIGKTNRGRAKDDITNEWLDDYSGDIQIAAVGIHAIPEFKVEIEAEKVSKEEYFEKKETEEAPHNW
jgi:hypothetical protein